MLRGNPWELAGPSEEMNNRGDTSEAPKTSVTEPCICSGLESVLSPRGSNDPVLRTSGAD